MLRAPLALLLLATLAIGQTPSSDVSVGVFPFLVGNMDGRVNEIATNCQLYGIDTVYVSVFRTTGPSAGQLWVTDSRGSWNPVWGAVRSGGAGIDLVALIAACHAQNVRVVGVVKCFDGSVQPDDVVHRQYLLDVLGYFVDGFAPSGAPIYDLDGIALDYVRYVGGSGVNPANVTNFVRDVRDRIGGLSLHAYLIANRYTFDGPNYNGQFASYGSVIGSLASQFGQHWEQLAPLLDVLMPMAYTANGSIYNSYALHQAYVARTAAYARTACQNASVPLRRVCPVIKTYSSSGETTTTQTIDASATGALLGGGDGYQSFRYQFLVNTPSWWLPMALHAVPGCNWPLPVVSSNSQFLTVAVDATASQDHEQSGASLLTRFDFDGDGAFDTAWGSNVVTQGLTRHPGPWAATIQVRDNSGHVSTTRRRVQTSAQVSALPVLISAATGGSVAVHFDVGPAGAGHIYLALASISGAAPGFVWQPGFPVPLNLDFLTTSLASNPNGGLLSHGLGQFNAQGHATATLNLPPGVASPFANSTVYWSFVAIDPAGSPSCVGGSGGMLLWP